MTIETVTFPNGYKCELHNCSAVEVPKNATHILTDPPYGINYISQTGSRPIVGDDKQFDPKELLSANLPTFIFGANNSLLFPIGGWIVWDKRCNKIADRVSGSPFELIWNNLKLYKIARVQHGGAINDDSFEQRLPVSQGKRIHPTQKPIRLMTYLVSLLTRNHHTGNGTIYDPYAGSCSSGIASVLSRYHWIGYEIDNEHFDNACKRLYNFRDRFDELKQYPFHNFENIEYIGVV